MSCMSLIIKDMNTTENKYTILAGAGVSLDAPANFPVAIQIINSLIDSISPNEIIKEKLKRRNIRATDPKYKLSGDFIRFEMLIDVVALCDENLQILDAIPNYKNPNMNHYNLAMLAINGHYIFTPNFDDLIERAIYNLGYIPQTICTEEDYNNFRFNRKKTIPVFKLHGSYYKYIGIGNRKKRVKSTLQASLTSIMTGNIQLLLPKFKNRILQKCIDKTSNIIFVGYSGADDFDIVPSLLKMNLKQIIWINHNNDVNFCNAVETDIDEDTGRNKLLRNQLKKQYDSVRLYNTNTRTFLSELGHVSEIPEHRYIPIKTGFSDNIENWGKQLSKDDKNYIVGELLFRLSFLHESYGLHEQILPNSTYFVGSQLRCISCIDQMSHYQDALKKLLILKQTPEIEKHHKYLDVLEKEAYLRYRISSNNAISEPLFRYVIEHANPHTAILQNVTNNYALFLRDNFRNNEALRFYKQSMEIAIYRGDSKHWCWVANNLATLLYDEGKFKEAEKICVQGYKRADMLGDYRQIGVLDNLLANIYFIKGEYDKSIEYCKVSIERDKYLGNENDSSVNELLLGQCYYEKGDFLTAKQHYDNSQRLFDSSDDRYFLYELLFYKIILSLTCNDLKCAETVYKQFSQNTLNKVEFVYKCIAEKLILFFNGRKDMNFKKELSAFVENRENKEIVGFINVVSYLLLLGIPPQFIGRNHIEKAKKIYNGINNSRKAGYLDSHMDL